MSLTNNVRHAFAFAVALASLTSSTLAVAGDLSKEECVDAHSRGQDAREAGKLSLARKLFLTCAQPSCPSLVQGDCARYADDLTRLQPSLSFSARDSSGSDLPDTTVYVDDVLVVTRLDGKAHDVDPGNHTVKFTNSGRDQVVTVVVGSGEKGRSVIGTFASANGAASAGATSGTASLTASAPVRATPKVTHPGGAKALIGVGTVLAIGGIGVGVWGLAKVPSNCSIGTHQCAAPPGDASFTAAADGVRLSNIGFVMAGVGVAAVAGGLVWYYKGSKREKEDQIAATPWVTPSSAGFAVSGSL